MAVHSNRVLDVRDFDDELRTDCIYQTQGKSVFSWPLPYDYEGFGSNRQYWEKEELAPINIPFKGL